MNLKKYLRRIMYRDTVTVSRNTLDSVQGTFVTKKGFQKIYEQIPCHLGKAGKQNEAHRDDVSEKLTYNLRLYCDPCYKIQPNDVLDVQHEGQELKLHAGIVFEYPNHTEIECFRRIEAGQK